MSNEKLIRPQLFEIKTDYEVYYVIAFNSLEALTLRFGTWTSPPDITSMKKLTGGFEVFDEVLIDPKCLGEPGLINKTVKK